MILRLGLLIVAVLLSFSLSARELRYLARSPKALLMGDAFTALADDEYTLFYNPAGLGMHSGLSVTAIDPKLEATNVLGELDRFKNVPTDNPVALSDRFLGFPLHIGTGVTPGVKMGTWGLTGLWNLQSNIAVENKTHPIIDAEYRYDRGFVTGFAYAKGKKGRGKSAVARTWSTGVGVKYIHREGIFRTYPVFGTELLTKFAALPKDKMEDSIGPLLDSLGYSSGSAWGADIGTMYRQSWGNSSFSYGLSVMDVGGTRFRQRTGQDIVPVQPMMVNSGVAYSQNFMLFHYTLSADLAPLNQPIGFARMMHYGFQFGIPFIDAYAGWNAGYLSYGLSTDVWLFKVFAGFYGIEMGSEFKARESQRAVIYISLLDFSFDV